MGDPGIIGSKYRALAGRLDEATLRLWAAVEARTLGRGGVSTVAKAIGISRTTIYAGLEELELASSPSGLARSPAAAIGKRVRAKGGGRKRLTDKDATLLRDLDALVEPTARGDPMSPLRWTCKSTPRLAQELAERGTRSANAAFATFWRSSTIACSRRARRGKAAIILIVTPSSSTSPRWPPSTRRPVIR